MSRICTVCTHEKRREIDRALVGGQPNRRIASQYGATEASIRRHKAHIPATLAVASAAKDSRRGNDLWARVERVMERLETALDGTSVAKDVASLSRELLGALRLALEGRGELRSGTQVNVALLQSPEWTSLRSRIVAALAGYPEAREAVLATLSEADGHG